MNRWQMTRQIQHVLAEWTFEGSSNLVFSDVISSAGVPQVDDGTADLRIPYAVVAPVGSTSRGQNPDWQTASWDIGLVTRNEIMRYGQQALLGGGRVGGETSNRGRGLLELEEEVQRALRDVNQVEGFSLRLKAVSAAAVAVDTETGYTIGEALRFDGEVTALRTYQEATYFRATEAVGSVTLKWEAHPDRFDFFRFVLRRAAGSTPPATADQGTGVTLSSDTATSVIDSVAAGTYSYSLFIAYDDFVQEGEAATSERNYSDPVSLTATAT